MLQQVDVGIRSFEDYRPIIGEQAVEEIRTLAALLQGLRVLVSALSSTGRYHRQ